MALDKARRQCGKGRAYPDPDDAGVGSGGTFDAYSSADIVTRTKAHFLSRDLLQRCFMAQAELGSRGGCELCTTSIASASHLIRPENLA